MSMIQLLAGSAPSNSLFYDSLGYADAAAAATGGWTNSGTVAWGDTSGPGSFSGVASLLIQNSASNLTTSAAFTSPAGTVYIYLKKFAVHTNTNDNQFLYLRNGSSNKVSIMARSSATDVFRITDVSGGATSTGSTTYTLDTVYPLKVLYTPGTGANGVIRVYLSLDGTTWTQVVSRTTSNATELLTNVRFVANTSCGIYGNSLLVSTLDILPSDLP